MAESTNHSKRQGLKGAQRKLSVYMRATSWKKKSKYYRNSIVNNAQLPHSHILHILV